MASVRARSLRRRRRRRRRRGRRHWRRRQAGGQQFFEGVPSSSARKIVPLPRGRRGLFPELAARGWRPAAADRRQQSSRRRRRRRRRRGERRTVSLRCCRSCRILERSPADGSADGYGELLLRQADGRARWFEGSPKVSLDESTPGGEDVQFHSGLAPVQDDGFRRVAVLQGGDQILRAIGPSCNEMFVPRRRRWRECR